MWAQISSIYCNCVDPKCGRRRAHPFFGLHRRCLPLAAMSRVQCTHCTYCFSQMLKSTNVTMYVRIRYPHCFTITNPVEFGVLFFMLRTRAQPQCNLHQIRNQSIGGQSSKMQWMASDIDNLIFSLACGKLNLFIWIDVGNNN